MAKKKKAEIKKKKPTASKKEPSEKEKFETQIQELRDRLESLTGHLDRLKAEDQELDRLCREEALKKQLCVAHLKGALLEESRRLTGADERLSELGAQTELTARREAEKRTAVEQNQQLTVSVLRQQCKELEEKLAELGDRRGERRAQQENIRQMRSLIALKNARIRRRLREEELERVRELLASRDSLARDCKIVRKGWQLHLQLERQRQDPRQENEDLKREAEAVRRRIRQGERRNRSLGRRKRSLGLDVEMQELMQRLLRERMAEQDAAVRRLVREPGGLEHQDSKQPSSDGLQEWRQEKQEEEKQRAEAGSEEEKQPAGDGSEEQEEEKQRAEAGSEDEKQPAGDGSEEQKEEKQQAIEGSKDARQGKQPMGGKADDPEEIKANGEDNNPGQAESASREQRVDGSQANGKQQQLDTVEKQLQDASTRCPGAMNPEEADSVRRRENQERDDQGAPDSAEEGLSLDSSSSTENKRSDKTAPGRPQPTRIGSGTDDQKGELPVLLGFQRTPRHGSLTPLEWIEMSRNALKDFAQEVARIQEDQEKYIQSIEREIEKKVDKNGMVMSALLKAGQVFQGRRNRSVDYKPSDVDPEVLNQIKTLMDMSSL